MNGLTDKEVLENREKYGTNAITSKNNNSFLNLLMESLGDPIIKILLIALAIKTIFLLKNFDWYETIGIVIAIFLASFISSISEYGSEKAFEKLQAESSKIKCRVKRNNKIVEVKIDDIVKNDIVLLETGDKIPADGIIIEGNVTVDESSLNGEAVEVYKNVGDKVFRGTVVYSKRAFMKVSEVGDKTFYGKLSEEIQEKASDSPLKVKLRRLAHIISKIGYIGSGFVAISYLFSIVVLHNNFNVYLIFKTLTNFPFMAKHILYALTLSVTIIVVAVPEGLPMMITLVLSSNMKRMLKNNVLVRKMVGIETAGSLNILFSDKTGTITNGKLEVIDFVSGKLKHYSKMSSIPDKLRDVVKISMCINNESNVDKNKIVGGNITDRAILEFANCGKPNIKIKKMIPFDSKNKCMITELKDMTLIKGAPEKIIPFIDKYYDEIGYEKSLYNKTELKNFIDVNTKKGVRIILMATYQDEKHMTLVGLILIKDEIRKEAIEGINLVKKANVQTVMITGDNKNTALSIGKEVGLFKDNDLILTSDELNNMSDEEIKRILPRLRIVARALPSDKSRLVRISKDMNLVVGMTGDGVNDAPALKKADVGFAMGSGTEVAKEASDIVILDNNFLSISKAILFGRTIFKSIRKFIIFQLTLNICAVSLSIIGPFIGIDTPVTVIQMLWINMVMDTLAGLAFSFEPPALEYMNELPKKKDELIINKYMINEILFMGSYSSLLSILFLKLPFFKNIYRDSPDNLYLMTAFFALFIFMGIFNGFNARTHRLNIFHNILENKVFLLIFAFIFVVQVLMIYYGGSVFRTSGLNASEFFFTLLIAFTVIPVDMLRKSYLRRKNIIGGV